jgi:flagellar basal-body rod modification protein FlgD
MSITSVLNSAQPVSQAVPASVVTNGAASSTVSTSGTSASGQMLTEQDFLTLLITQLQNQDPTKPASDTQLAQEMAGFTTANGMSNADTLLQQISASLNSLDTTLGVGTSGTAAVPVSSSSTPATSGTVA